MSGCERPADTSRLITLRQDAMEFEYPGNWEVTENRQLTGARLIQIEAPGNALTTISVFPADRDVDLRAYVERLSSEIKKNILVGEITKSEISGKGDAISVAYIVRLGNVDVPHTENFTLHKLASANVICMTQVADEDRYLVEPGFDVIRRSIRDAKAGAPGR